MKKFMRIALVFALAGAALVGCTKDYSGDISDLNKKVSEQQSAVTALQNAVSNAQSAADAAASTANTALSTAKAAATADELNAVKAELAKAATADALTAVDAKYAAYIPAIEAAAKAADLDEFKTLVAEEIAKLATKDEVAAFKAAYDEMVAALEAADKENDGKIAELKAACDTKFAALDAADKQNAEAIVALQEALTNAIENAQAADKQNADAIAALTETFNSTVAELQAADTKNAEAIAALKADYEAKVAALEAGDTQNAEAIAALKADYEAKVAALEAAATKNAEAIEALKADYEAQVAVLKAADTKNAEAIEALEAATATAIAATNVSIEDIKAALAAHKTEFDAAVERILALETNYIELEARVLALEEADEEIRALIAENKAGIAENKAAIEALQKKVEELLAQAYTELTTISAPASAVQVNFDYAVYNPTDQNTTKATKAAYKALAEEFPEITEIKEKTGYVQGGHVPFVVNPASVQFDENDTFKFVNVKGKEYPGTLSTPVKGFEGIENVEEGKMTTKSSEYGYWTLTLAPTWDAKTGGFKNENGLSLVVTDGENVATTPFVYGVTANTIGAEDDIIIELKSDIKYAPEIDLLDKVAVVVDEHNKQKLTEALSFEHEMTGKFILEAATDEECPDNSIAIEKYGISFDGSKVLIAKYPEGEKHINFSVAVTALGLNGSADRKKFELTVGKAISADGVLAAKEVVLKGTASNTKPYMIRWNLADYDFSRAELKEFITAGSHKFAYDYKYVENNTEKHITGTKDVYFYDSQKKRLTDLNNEWSKAVTFGFNITSDGDFAPREYDVLFTVSDAAGQTTIYAAKSTFTVTNDEEVTGAAVKLLDTICDKDGTLLAVGSANGEYVTYDFAKAFVVKTTIAEVTGYKDLEYNKDADESVSNYNWIQRVTFETETSPRDGLKIKANGQTDDYHAKYNYVNNTTRNIRANITYFGNQDNLGTVDFKVKVISPIYSETGASLSITNATIAFGKSVELNTILGVEGTYVVGPDATKKFQLLQTWKKNADTPATYEYYRMSGNAYNAPNISADSDLRPELTGDIAAAFGDDVSASSRYVFDKNNDPIVFNTFDKEYLKFFNSAIKTSDIQKINEWRAGEHYSPVYLTNRMFKKFAAIWARYYEADGDPKTITLNGETYLKESYKQIWLAQVEGRTWDDAYWAVLSTKSTDDIRTYLGGEANRLKAKNILESDQVAVDLFKEYEDLVKDEVDPVVPDDGYTEDKGRSANVEKVTVKFDDPDVADKFVYVSPATGFVDPYESDNSVKLNARANYSPADLNGKTSVDVTGTVEVLDAWGMTTKKAFKITCTIPTN